MTELTVTRTLRAGRDRVWTAWTDGAELARWFWPPTFATEASLDVCPGGAWRIASVRNGMAVSGEFVAVEPLQRLVYTWRWDGEDAETLVTVTFAETDAGDTAISLTHERFDDEQSAADHEHGWNDCLDRLPPAIGDTR